MVAAIPRFQVAAALRRGALPLVILTVVGDILKRDITTMSAVSTIDNFNAQIAAWWKMSWCLSLSCCWVLVARCLSLPCFHFLRCAEYMTLFHATRRPSHLV